MKVPLKIKIFLWYLRRGMILTKDNLTKRNWPGSKKCCFCHSDETINHLFFQCKFACAIWLVIQVASNLYPSSRAANMFGNWLLPPSDYLGPNPKFSFSEIFRLNLPRAARGY
jgi:hypothetical protein